MHFSMRLPLGLHHSPLELFPPGPDSVRKFMIITADLRMLLYPCQTPETARQRPATGPTEYPVHSQDWLLAPVIDITGDRSRQTTQPYPSQ